MNRDYWHLFDTKASHVSSAVALTSVCVRIRSRPIFTPLFSRSPEFMNKTQLVDAIAKNTQLTKTSVEDVLNLAIETIKKSVKKGDDVTLVGFGTFTKSKRKARAGRNPQTGNEIKIPAMTVPRFRAGKEFKDSLR